MHLDLRINDVDLMDALRVYVDLRLHFALSRFGDRVGLVTVRVFGVRSSRSIGMTCRVSAEFKPFGTVVVEDTDVDLYSAVDRATGRIGHLFGRRLKRARDMRLGRETVRAA